MQLIKDLILLSIAIAGVTNTVIALSAHYDSTMRSEARPLRRGTPRG